MPTDPEPVTCSVCGVVADQPPLTWVRETSARGRVAWVCQSCAREHLRAIEARLDQEWW